MTTKQDFLDWKHHPVTQEVFIKIKALSDELTEKLIVMTGSSGPVECAETAGSIKAFRELLEINWEGEDS